MSTKRVFLIVLTIILLILATRIRATWALPLKLTSDTPGDTLTVPSVPMAPPMGGEIEISNPGGQPSVTYNPVHDVYLVVSSVMGLCINFTCSYDIDAQHVSSRGELIGSKFSIATQVGGEASVAYDPINDRYLVVWPDNKDIFGRFIPWEGVDPTLSAFKICDWASEQYNPSVAYALAQGEFLVVWENVVSGVPDYISGRRVNAANGSFPVGGFTIASHSSQPRYHPSVAYNLARNEYLITYDNDADIYATRLRGDGNIMGGGEFGITHWSDAEVHPGIAASHAYDQYLVVWQSRQASSDKFYARFVNGDSSLGSAHLIGDYQVVAGSSAIGFDVTCRQGLQYLVTWEREDTSTGQISIWGRLVYPNATLDQAFEIALPGYNSAGSSASGVLNDMVTWSTSTGIGLFNSQTRGRIIGESNPKAVFTVAPSGGEAGTVFSFDASGSYDAQDPASALQVRWDWEDDGVYDTPWSTTKAANHTFAAFGTYDVRLEVQDTYGLSDTTTRQVNVWLSFQVAPVASFTVSPPSGDTNTVFTFDASGCSDWEDPISALEVRWDWNNDGIFETGWSPTKTATHIFSTAGMHTVRLEVLDTGGLTNATTQQVTVSYSPPSSVGILIYLPLIRNE